MTCTQEQFLNRVKDHQITVLRDDGLYRHIRFKAPKSGNDWFDLITWPGCLCINGDMGTYTFSRLEDMFEFFRTDGGKINPHYWAEKIQSDSRYKGAEEFSTDKFKQVINQYRLNWIREKSISKDARRELWEAVDYEVLSSIDDGEQAACWVAQNFSHRAEGKEFSFDDLFEHTFTDYTYHYLWCCHAIAWGIAQYDAYKAAENVSPAPLP